MTPTLVLHIGPHKTATTTLQSGLLSAQAFLAAHGWHYPSLGLVQFGQHNLQRLFIGDRSGQEGVRPEDFARLLREHERIVISSENFCHFDLEPIRAIRRAVPAHVAVQIVLYVRGASGLWPSHWQETIRQGHSNTLMDHLATLTGFKALFSPVLSDPVAIANRYATVFGKECLRILCYDNIPPDDMLGFFVRTILGIGQPLPQGEPLQQNMSMPDELIEMLRCLNQCALEATGTRPRQEIAHAYLAHRARVEAGPGHAQFVAAFQNSCNTVTIDSANPVIRQRERNLLNRFGAQIENRAAEDQLFTTNATRRTLNYGERHWPSRFGMAGYIESVFAGLPLA